MYRYYFCAWLIIIDQYLKKCFYVNDVQCHTINTAMIKLVIVKKE